jgi:hypothetical protein
MLGIDERPVKEKSRKPKKSGKRQDDDDDDELARKMAKKGRTFPFEPTTDVRRYTFY